MATLVVSGDSSWADLETDMKPFQVLPSQSAEPHALAIPLASPRARPDPPRLPHGMRWIATLGQTKTPRRPKSNISEPENRGQQPWTPSCCQPRALQLNGYRLEVHPGF